MVLAGELVGEAGRPARVPMTLTAEARALGYCPPMQLRPLGRTGLEVSAVGFGAWGLAGELWRDVDPPEPRPPCAPRSTPAAPSSTPPSSTAAAPASAGRRGGARAARAATRAGRDQDPAARPALAARPERPARAGISRRARHSLGRAVAAQPAASTRSASSSSTSGSTSWLDDPYWPVLSGAWSGWCARARCCHWGISVNDHAPGDRAARPRPAAGRDRAGHLQHLRPRAGARAARPRGGAARSASSRAARSTRAPWPARSGPTPLRPGRLPQPLLPRRAQGRGRQRGPSAARRCSATRRTSLAELALRFCLSRPEVVDRHPGHAPGRAHAVANIAAADGRALSPAPARAARRARLGQELVRLEAP